MMEADSERWAWLAEGNARQARKRVSVDVLIRDRHGRVLLVDPTYKDGWDMPGGMAEANEPPRTTATRELTEELALDLAPGRLLLVEWLGPHGPWDDLIVMIFDGGTLDAENAACVRLKDGELAAFSFVPPGEARSRLRPYVADRLDAALVALAAGTTSYGEVIGGA